MKKIVRSRENHRLTDTKTGIIVPITADTCAWRMCFIRFQPHPEIAVIHNGFCHNVSIRWIHAERAMRGKKRDRNYAQKEHCGYIPPFAMCSFNRLVVALEFYDCFFGFILHKGIIGIIDMIEATFSGF